MSATSATKLRSELIMVILQKSRMIISLSVIGQSFKISLQSKVSSNQPHYQTFVTEESILPKLYASGY